MPSGRSHFRKLPMYIYFSCLSHESYCISFFLVSHGSLTSLNCVVNSRWSCQITDYGLHYIKQKSQGQGRSVEINPSKLLWTAPELLRSDTTANIGRGTQKGDVYSFAIITQEVVLLDTPFCDNNPPLDDAEIIRRVQENEIMPYRPHLDAGFIAL